MRYEYRGGNDLSRARTTEHTLLSDGNPGEDWKVYDRKTTVRASHLRGCPATEASGVDAVGNLRCELKNAIRQFFFVSAEFRICNRARRELVKAGQARLFGKTQTTEIKCCPAREHMLGGTSFTAGTNLNFHLSVGCKPGVLSS
ncbi:MAG TPA: hypothetical protein VJW77_16135 [Terriglobia bacterium]|nr:hypothetical protein [Terriglobia bacterium]